ncbi:TIGR01777 family protein [Marinobacter fuscus]|uniref:TIGR01777 family protein n=1 Tax=Marinobacter fuscus TaxID=2109942 RepID=A0A2T1K6N7_9GAMM|nr:TIGR01777 family oxidoreductase [Marinobacter fuscus]PSF05725.1 TIGR01777 family protein [Marinobacter fuscus]
MNNKILITGATGFIGQVLCARLIEKGYQLTVLSRQPSHAVRAICGRVDAISKLDEVRGAQGFSAIINLAGEGIADRRWSDSRKQALRDSRIGLTESLVQVVRTWGELPDVLVSGSAVGFYGDQGERKVTERTPPNDEFTHQLCRDWENAAMELASDGVRVCLSRTGIVTGRNGGFLQRMLLPFKLGLGGKLGNGRQFMPWVHREDVVAGLLWMLETDAAEGPYNMVSPNPVSNAEFTRTLARVLHRPAVLPAPAPALKLALGEMSLLLLTGQRAIPEKLLEQGFHFHYAGLDEALEQSVG